MFICFRKNENSTSYDKIVANIQQSQFLESCDLQVEDYALKICCKNVFKNLKDVNHRKSALNVKQNSEEWVKLRSWIGPYPLGAQNRQSYTYIFLISVIIYIEQEWKIYVLLLYGICYTLCDELMSGDPGAE